MSAFTVMFHLAAPLGDASLTVGVSHIPLLTDATWVIASWVSEVGLASRRTENNDIFSDKRERGKYVPEQVIAADFAMRFGPANGECFAGTTISSRTDLAVILKGLIQKSRDSKLG